MRLRYICKLLFVVVGAAVTVYCLSSIYFYYQEKPETDVELQPLPTIQKQTRLLVIAPHCDDEALGCAAIIHDVIQAGGQVLIVVMTNGDGFTVATEEEFHKLSLTQTDYVNSGYTRQKETVQALQLLGVPENQIIFLGYPDRGIRAIWTDYWNQDQPYQSRYTGSDRSPYNNSYQQNAPYAGQVIVSNLEQIMLSFRPNFVLAPHPADEHPDHATAWAFVVASLAKFKSSEAAPEVKLYTYLVHRGDFPIPHGYKTDAWLLPPKPLFQIQPNKWLTYPIDAAMESLKEQSIKAYVSQTRVPIMSSLLYSFIRKNELFAEPHIPHAVQKPLTADLSDLNAWSNQEPILVNPRGIKAIGELERKGKITAVDSYMQYNTIWLRFHIPEFADRQDEYQVSIIAFALQNDQIVREKEIAHFSTVGTDLPPDAIMRYQNDVIVKIPLIQPQLPSFFFIQAVTKDKFGTMIDHTVWQPVFLSKF
jgi:LmbE family N-acetylglucosaminyl deacetylase